MHARMQQALTHRKQQREGANTRTDSHDEMCLTDEVNRFLHLSQRTPRLNHGLHANTNASNHAHLGHHQLECAIYDDPTPAPA